jgi:hypothetical protein
MMMIHKAWGMAIGNCEDMRATSDLLDKIDGLIAGAYADRAGDKGDKANIGILARKPEYLPLLNQWLTPERGFEPAQAAVGIEAAVQADGASHITFERCEIGHLGIYGIWFRKGCSDNTVRQCHIHDFGAGAFQRLHLVVVAAALRREGRARGREDGVLRQAFSPDLRNAPIPSPRR